jgi:hypothetical protein
MSCALFDHRRAATAMMQIRLTRRLLPASEYSRFGMEFTV